MSAPTGEGQGKGSEVFIILNTLKTHSARRRVTKIGITTHVPDWRKDGSTTGDWFGTSLGFPSPRFSLPPVLTSSVGPLVHQFGQEGRTPTRSLRFTFTPGVRRDPRGPVSQSRRRLPGTLPVSPVSMCQDSTSVSSRFLEDTGATKA